MMENNIFFKWDKSSETKSLAISGVKIQVKDFRIKIEQLYNPKKDDFQLQYEGRVLDISNEIRNKQIVSVIRVPKNKNICLACFNRNHDIVTPCCQKPICYVCDSVFSQKSKCFFNLNQQCHYKYSESFQQAQVPEPPLHEFITYNSVFYLMRCSKQIIAHARRYSVWTTREITYLKLAEDCNIPAHVILIFINNDEFLGCAKMINQLVVCESQPLQSTVKSMKSFKILWFRKLTSLNFVHEFPNLDIRDGSKLPPQIGKQICQSFPIGQQLIECKPQQQQQSTADEWDMEEILKDQDQEETVKKCENQSTVEKTSDFNITDQEKKTELQTIENVTTAVETLSQTQQLFDKLNNGQISGIKGNVKYTHPLLKQLFLSMVQNSLKSGQEKLGETKQLYKRRKDSRSSSSSSNSSGSSSQEKRNSKASASNKSDSKKEKKQLKSEDKKRDRSIENKSSQRKKSHKEKVEKKQKSQGKRKYSSHKKSRNNNKQRENSIQQRRKF